jgi:hypothetical protein
MTAFDAPPRSVAIVGEKAQDEGQCVGYNGNYECNSVFRIQWLISQEPHEARYHRATIATDKRKHYQRADLLRAIDTRRFPAKSDKSRCYHAR